MPDLLDSADPGRGDRPLTTPFSRDAQRSASAPALPSGSRLNEAAAAPVLLCQRVSKWYGPVIGVNQVTLELRSGITGLVGANGAGKSTLMRLIT